MSCLGNAKIAVGGEAHQEDVRVETISTYQAFLQMKPVWDRLVEAAEVDYPFLEHDWVRTWWECFGKGSSFYILLVKSADEPIAIAPMIITTTRICGIKVRRLGFFYNAHVPRTDFIVADRPAEVYRVIWEHIHRNCLWDVVQLCQLPQGSPTLQELSRLAAKDRCLTGIWLSGASPYQPLCTSWSQYFSSLATKHRSNLRNRLKRLKGKGAVEIEVVTSNEELGDALDAGLQLEAAAWKGEAHTAICSDPNISRFYSTLAWRAAERGWIRLQFLDVGPNRVAFDYSLSYKNRIYKLKSGYDPAYAPYSPSNLLSFLVLQNAFKQGAVEYDFLGENEEWKLQWAKQTKPHYWLYVFFPTFKGRLLYIIKFRFVPLFKRGLRKLNGFISQLNVRSPIRALQETQ